MSDPSPTLTADEASAIDAIASAAPAQPAAAAEQADAPAHDGPAEHTHDDTPTTGHGNEGGALPHEDAHAHDAGHGHDAHTPSKEQAEEDTELAEMRSTMLDSAQLANRAAGIVVGKFGTAVVRPEELFPEQDGEAGSRIEDRGSKIPKKRKPGRKSR